MKRNKKSVLIGIGGVVLLLVCIIVLISSIVSCSTKKPVVIDSIDSENGQFEKGLADKLNDMLYSFLDDYNRQTNTMGEYAERFMLNADTRAEIEKVINREEEYAGLYERSLIGTRVQLRNNSPSSTYAVATLRSDYLVKGVGIKTFEIIYEDYYMANINYDWKILRVEKSYFYTQTPFMSYPVKPKQGDKQKLQIPPALQAFINETAIPLVLNDREKIQIDFGTLRAATVQKFPKELVLTDTASVTECNIVSMANTTLYYKLYVTTTIENGKKGELKENYRQYKTVYIVDCINLENQGWKMLSVEFVQQSEVTQ